MTDTQALRDALDAVKKSEAGGQYTIAAHKAYAFLTAHGEDLLARLADGDMVLVPREPTYQMAEAMGVKWESGEGFPRRWKAALAAAPAQPSEGEPR